MPTPLPPLFLDAQKEAEVLIHEFLSHLKEMRLGEGAKTEEEMSDRTIFEGWTIQKMANIQVAIKTLTEHLKAIESMGRK